MKQHITKAQWEEITPEQQQEFHELLARRGTYLLEIGSMIEFLGEDLKDIQFWKEVTLVIMMNE